MTSAPSRGSEQAGRRPALVIQNDVGNRNTRYPDTVVLAMSTRGMPVPFHVRLDPDRNNALRSVSYVKCEQILTISKERLIGKKPRGSISPDQMHRVETAVKLSLDLR